MPERAAAATDLRLLRAWSKRGVLCQAARKANTVTAHRSAGVTIPSCRAITCTLVPWGETDSMTPGNSLNAAPPVTRIPAGKNTLTSFLAVVSPADCGVFETGHCRGLREAGPATLGIEGDLTRPGVNAATGAQRELASGAMRRPHVKATRAGGSGSLDASR